MTGAGAPPPPAPIWPGAVREGLLAFGLVAGVGVAASVIVWAIAGPAYGLGVALRIGVLYLGAFHHVPIRIEGDFDIGEVTGGVLPNSDLPTASSSFVEIGIALLSVTMLASWLLFRAGRRLAASPGGSVRDHLLRGAAVAPAYALPVFLAALLVTIDEPVAFGRLVEGELRVSLAHLQALLFPLVLAAAAGAAGGMWAWLEAHHDRERAATTGAALSGGWRMLWLGLALSYAGLFAAGVAQPDEPVAALTPSTARYFDLVFERTGLGAAILGHHLAFAPNEAAWTLVPAAGGCDSARGSVRADLVCYRRFPRDLGWVLRSTGLLTSAPDGGLSSVGAPAGYYLFLLAPAVATVLGGRHAAQRLLTSGRAGAWVGALGGVVFALLLGAASLLAGVSLDYGATVGGRGGGGSLWIGPDVASAVLVGLAWGLLGGALGGATAYVRSAAETPGAGPTAR